MMPSTLGSGGRAADRASTVRSVTGGTGGRSSDGRGGFGSSAPKVSRLDRRKARTRQALIDAAVRLIAEGRGDRASIQEITEAADIGFGSFYNHFDSKDQLFQTASRRSSNAGGR